MTNLNEQWKKGELPSDWYWVKMSFQGAIIPLYYSEDYGFEYDDHFFDFEEISEVLAPVPSYEEWKSAQEQLHKEGVWYTEISYKKVLRENKQLKELLKESRFLLSKTPCENMSQCLTFNDVINRIDQAL